jgi:hypothetical protein
MTELEISKALALAIGWKETDLLADGQSTVEVWAPSRSAVHVMRWRPFDYRDWAIIGPIAEKYDCFPRRVHGQWTVGFDRPLETTPQEAIALAVIWSE